MSIPIILCVGMWLSAAAMAGILLGVANHAIRFAIAPFAILLNSFVLGWVTGLHIFDWTGAAISALTTLVIFLTIEISKMAAGKFLIPGAEATVEDAFQFRISHLMIATAAVAVFISVAKWLGGFININSGVAPVTIFLVTLFVAVFAIITLANLWAFMGTKVKNKVVVATFISFLAAGGTFLLPAMFQMTWLALFLICWLAILAQLWVLRREGVRFVRRQE